MRSIFLLLVWFAISIAPPAHARLSESVVLDADFPDPSVLLASDGWYYAYATQTIPEGPRVTPWNVQVARSRDLQQWQLLGDALPVKPNWARTTQMFWAPHVSFYKGRYYMYYSALPDTTDNFCLAVAVSVRPQGPFRDVGRPLKCGKSFTHIDPMAFDDPETGKALLYWGSGWDPIQVQELADNRIELKPGTQPQPLVYPRNDFVHMKLIEGAWVTRENGFYYLFMSGDSCCDPARYAVVVARSKSATGPFELMGNGDVTKSVILHKKKMARFYAPGHNAVIRDKQGQYWMLYHAIDKTNPKLERPIRGDRQVRRIMLRAPMAFVNGWPVIPPEVSRN